MQTENWPVGKYDNHSNRQMVLEFTEKMAQPVGVAPSKKDVQLFQLRTNLIAEEFKEAIEAIQNLWQTMYKGNNKASYEQAKQETLKELMDIMYVVEGFCVTYGWDSTEAFKRVHESNMSKLEDGKPVMSPEGKVLKGKNYKAPDLSDLVKEETNEI